MSNLRLPSLAVPSDVGGSGSVPVDTNTGAETEDDGSGRKLLKSGRWIVALYPYIQALHFLALGPTDPVGEERLGSTL